MNELPSRLHRLLAVPFFVGLLLLLASLAFDARALGAFALVVFCASACGLAIADLRHLLTTRQGLGRRSGHITEAANPVSFKLHVGLLLFLAVLWGGLFVVGLRWVLP